MVYFVLDIPLLGYYFGFGFMSATAVIGLLIMYGSIAIFLTAFWRFTLDFYLMCTGRLEFIYAPTEDLMLTTAL
jgi:hypothetical protein